MATQVHSQKGISRAAKREAKERTYHQVVELEAAGMQRKEAFTYLAETSGDTFGAISQRYYTMARELREAGESVPLAAAPAQAAQPRAAARDSTPPRRRSSEPDKSAAEGMDIIVTLLRGLIEDVKQLEHDAAQWRALQEMLAT